MYKIENCASKIDEAEVQHYTSEEGNRLDQGSSIFKGVFKSYYSIVWNRLRRGIIFCQLIFFQRFPNSFGGENF